MSGSSGKDPSPGTESLDDSKYRLLVEAVTDYALYMLDAGGHVSSWNPGARRFKGYSAQEILGVHFSAFYMPEDRAAGLPERALRISAEQGKFEGEGWRVRKDGSRFWAHVVIDPIWDGDHHLLGFAKITRDLTERKAVEAALKRSEEQFSRLVQGVTDYAIYMLDENGNVASWNSGATRIKGYEADEIVGQHFSRFYREQDRAAGHPEHALATARREGRFESEGWRIRKDGSAFWANVVVDPIRSDQGEIIGFAKITRDVTAKRDAEQALLAARESLFQSQKLEAVGRLTGGVAHDFNNLLTVILTSLELMRRLPADDPRHARLRDNATQAAHRGAALTHRMLSFARQQSLSPTRVDTFGLTQGISDLLAQSAGPDVRIRVERVGAPQPVLIDANQLELALLNLVANARDAMPADRSDGAIKIEIADASDPPPRSGLATGRYVRLSVSDNGQGMDADTLARAAEPFFTTKGVGKGTGLGLPMVHGLAHQSGGYLDMDSEPGHGTTVTLWLPVAQEGAAADIAAATPATAAPRSSAEAAGMHLLVVDDDSLVLANAVAMLEALGHTVVGARSGAQALECLARDAGIELLLSDQVMPQMSGLQLIERVLQSNPQLPVILASGYRHAALPVPDAVVKLSKPFDLDTLAAALAEAVDMKRRRGQVPSSGLDRA